LACFASFEVFLVMIVSLNHKGACRAPFELVAAVYYGVGLKLSRELPRLLRGFDPGFIGSERLDGLSALIYRALRASSNVIITV
jgi:hypothetical protein